MNIGSLTGQIGLEDQFSGHLTTITSHVRQFAQNFSSSLTTTVAVAGLVTASVAGMAASIVNLGEKGSVILGVEESFDRLAQRAGSTGEALIGGLTQGVKSTIDSMVLMQSTTRLLSSGVKLTEADMQVMGATAREMGKATGTDAAGGLNTLSQALLTGNTRSLKRFGINIDLVKSETEFARSLGTTRDQLSAAGQLEARRVAMLEGMRTKLDVLGTSELTFRERLQQSRVAVGNWFDSLAKGIAGSAAVNKAFDAIRDSIIETFGGSSQTLLQTILGWIDKFAGGAARIGPIVVRGIGQVKDVIVSIWTEVVAFNERWQITNNIVVGAKFAWGLLEKAFYLVRSAVMAVIDAWSSMPDWLQRITKTTLEGSVALAAYSVAINAVSVPFRAMVDTIDLGINILGNLTGAIFNIVTLQKMWGGPGGPIDWTTAAYARLTIAIQSSTVATIADGVATRSIAQAKLFWSGVLTAINNTMLVTIARTWLMEAALRASAIATGIATIAKGLFNAALVAVNGTAVVMTARLWLMNAGIAATGISSKLATVGMTAFGSALLFIQSIPIVAALGAVILSLEQVKKTADALIEGRNFWDYMRERREITKDWIKDWVNFFTQFAFGADLFETSANRIEKSANKVESTFNRNRRKGGAAGPLPEIVPGALARESAEWRREQGIGLVSEGESFIKASTAAEDYAKKVRDLRESYAQAALGQSVFTDAFGKLNKAQRDNFDLQQILVPEIDKLAAAHKNVTPEMIRVRDAATSTRLALLAKDEATLASSGLTLGQIEHLKKLGLSEADIAFQYGVTAEALGRRSAAMQEAAGNEQRYASFQAAAVAQEMAARERQEKNEVEGFNRIGAAREELTELIVQNSMTALQLQKRDIEKWELDQITAFAASGKSASQVKVFSDVIKAQSRERLSALVRDNDALKNNSQTRLREIADNARETYLAMEAHPKEYSASTRRHFKKIAEDAEHAANGTRSAWDKTYDALGRAAFILDNITGKWAEIGSVAVKGAMSMMEAWSKGDWIGVAVAGITAVGTAIGKLVGWSREGRNAVKEFAASFDTLAEGTGFDELHAQLLRLGPPGEKLWIQLSQGTPAGNAEIAKQNIEKVKAALAALDADIQKYNLTWMDMVDAQIGGIKAGTALAETYKRLMNAGFSADKILRAMSGDLNQFIVDSVRAGTKIPPALQPIIEQLIRSKGLTQEAARAMLGLAETSMPSLADITAAAERYGIKLEELGPKVKQLQITELADQYVKDWNILTLATDDWGVLFDKMGPKVQDLVLDAMKYGSELPANMRPMIQAFIDAGRLVDANGEKLTDLSKLTFAQDLSEMFEDLILKLDELIDKIGTGVGGALEDIGRRVIRPRIEPQIVDPGAAYVPEGGEVRGYVGGGRVLPFKARGTDTVPAMLTPGERVLTVSENQAYERGGRLEVTMPVVLDGKKVGEGIVRYVPGALKRGGL